MLNLHIYPTVKGAAKAAADMVAGQLREKPESNLGLGAGRTFEPFYEELVKMHGQRVVPFSKFRSFQVNEFMGMPGTHPMSYRFFLVDTFFDHIPAVRRFQKRLPGLPVNIDATCNNFEERIKRFGGLDLIILGLGYEDWLGFNERGTPFTSKTHEVALSDDIREYYASYFPRGSVPRRGITMGIKTITDAKRILLLVTGEHKADAMERLFKATISPQTPSTALRKLDNVEIFADEAAAAKVKSFQKKGSKSAGKNSKKPSKGKQKAAST